MLLGSYGIPIPAWRAADTAEGAGEAADELGGEVALKAQGGEILHKSEMGAVRIGLSGAEQVAAAAGEMDEAVERAGAKREKFIVQQMAEDGPELLVGVADDPTFGPVLACGAGGTQAELLSDVAIRVSPITRTDAFQMIHSLATFPLLTGFRGAPPADVDAIEELLLRVSAMVEAHTRSPSSTSTPCRAARGGRSRSTSGSACAPPPAALLAADLEVGTAPGDTPPMEERDEVRESGSSSPASPGSEGDAEALRSFSDAPIDAATRRGRWSGACQQASAT